MLFITCETAGFLATFVSVGTEKTVRRSDRVLEEKKRRKSPRMKNTCIAVLVVCAALGPGMFTEGQSTQPTDSVSFGLEVGEKAPPFTLKDQFGNKQSNETLQGTTGTVLLFVRSADL